MCVVQGLLMGREVTEGGLGRPQMGGARGLSQGIEGRLMFGSVLQS